MDAYFDYRLGRLQYRSGSGNNRPAECTRSRLTGNIITIFTSGSIFFIHFIALYTRTT